MLSYYHNQVEPKSNVAEILRKRKFSEILLTALEKYAYFTQVWSTCNMQPFKVFLAAKTITR